MQGEEMAKGNKSRREIASKAGLARAATMDPEARSEIARGAALARWGKTSKAKLPAATHYGVLRIGELEFPCFVLEDGSRVLSGRGLAVAFGQRSSSQGAAAAVEGARRVPAFLASKAIFPFVSEELLVLADNPVRFGGFLGGGAGLGYQATILPEICKAILQARGAQALKPHQIPMAVAAEVLLFALAKTGIVALVDEATGYQYERARRELQQILNEYIQEDLRPWTKRFSNSFFKEIYRIHGWKFEEGVTQGPRYVGRFINEFIYKQLPDGVLDELRRRNPPIKNNQRRHKHFQLLTEDTGDEHLDRLILKVTTLMQVADNKKHFETLFGRAFAKPGQMSLPIPDPNDDLED
jgi:hypothetical protein